MDLVVTGVVAGVLGTLVMDFLNHLSSRTGVLLKIDVRMIGRMSMDIRSEQLKVAAERRMDARLELQFDATVTGISGIPKITNISLGGFFLKGDIPDRIEIGQIKAINVKLPSEMYVTRFKAKVMRKNYRGIGCQLTNQNGREWDTLFKFFKFYKFYNDINP